MRASLAGAAGLFDVFLYVAFGVGLVAGCPAKWRSPWVERATVADIVLLVALLGASLIQTSVPIQAATIQLALVFAAVLLTAAALLTFVLPRRPSGGGTGKRPRSRGALVLVALAVG